MTNLEQKELFGALKKANLYGMLCTKIHDFYNNNKKYYNSEKEIFDHVYLDDIIHAFLSYKEQKKFYEHYTKTEND